MFRTLLFIPGNNKRFIEKAKSLNADIICFDLEDSVPLNEKQAARDLVSEALEEKKIMVTEMYTFESIRTNQVCHSRTLML